MFQTGFSRRAIRDLDRILDWLRQRSPSGAQRWLDALEQMQARLSATPFSFPLAEESDAFPEPIRQILFRTRRGNTYRALYVVRGAEVTILCIRGPGQPPLVPDDVDL